MKRSLSLTTLKVLRALLDGTPEDNYGRAIQRRTRIASGSLYPILWRLREQGWVCAEWEDIDHTVEARANRCYYSLTRQGRLAARREVTATVAALRG